VCLRANKGTHLESLRNVFMAGPYERCRCALGIKNFCSLLLGVALDNNCLLLIEFLNLTVPTRYHRRIVVLLTLISHHLHKLVLVEAVDDLSIGLVRVVERLCCLPKLLRGFPFRRGGVVFVWAARLLLANDVVDLIYLRQILVCDRVFGRPAPSMVHLLRWWTIVSTLVCSCLRTTGIFKSVNAPIPFKWLGDRRIFAKLAHKHLLVGLLGCEHIWICFWRHFNELFVVSLHLSHMLVCKLVRVWGTGWAYGGLCVRPRNVLCRVTREVVNIEGSCLAFRSDISDWSRPFLIHQLHALPLACLNAWFFDSETCQTCNSCLHVRHRCWTRHNF